MWRRGLTAWSLGWLGSACSALIAGELGVVRCLDEHAYGPPACPQGSTCIAGICASVGAPVGQACNGDADCRAPAGCIDQALIGQGSGRRCLLPCCASSDCGPVALGLLCRPIAGGAGSFCWPESELSNRDAPGDATAGASCTVSAQCRSGLCEAGRCTDSCCGDPSCAQPGDVCRITASGLSAQPAWSCAAAPAPTSKSGDCMGDNDCRTGSCSMTYMGKKYCLEVCCSSRDCTLVVSSEMRVACAPQASVRACVRVLPKSATLAVGASCDSANACKSGLCIATGGAKYCSDVCCNDASCGDTSRFLCRPGPVDGAWALRCVRK